MIHSYNTMAVVLQQYEVLHLQRWSQAAQDAPQFLNTTLLVRHEDSEVSDPQMLLAQAGL